MEVSDNKVNVHKTEMDYNHRSKCGLKLDDFTDQSFCWKDVTCKECLRFKGAIDRRKGKQL